MRYGIKINDGRSVVECDPFDFGTAEAMQQEAVRTLQEIVREAPLSTEARHFVVEVRPENLSEPCFRASVTFTTEVPD